MGPRRLESGLVCEQRGNSSGVHETYPLVFSELALLSESMGTREFGGVTGSNLFG